MVPCVSSRTHPKNTTNVVKKKVVRSWKGAPKKIPLTVKKNLEVESKKPKKYMIFDVLVPEMEKLVIFVFTE